MDQGLLGVDKVAVMIVDSEQALAQALAESLRQEPAIADARAAAGPLAAAAAMNGHTVDVVVVAMDSDGWDPIEFISELGRRSPRPAIIAMSGDDDPGTATAAIRAGALSWVAKQASMREFASIVVSTARGAASWPPELLGPVLRRLTPTLAIGAQESPLARLTVRERQILEFTAQGLTRRAIAVRLGVSVNTVRTHSQHMLSKLGVHTTLEAVALALRERAVAHRPLP
ncbi:MAG TPA: response regulator transcription factor [Catenuloplanes sp.]|jgi:DNA-binding NarL/FixJ family response regulator